MNLAVIIPWDFYAIRHADGWTAHGIDSDAVEQHLIASCVEHVLLVTASSGRPAWSRLRAQLGDAAMNVDEIPFAEWQAHLIDRNIDSINFPTIDDERTMLADWLVAFSHQRGGL